MEPTWNNKMQLWGFKPLSAASRTGECYRAVTRSDGCLDFPSWQWAIAANVMACDSGPLSAAAK